MAGEFALIERLLNQAGAGLAQCQHLVCCLAPGDDRAPIAPGNGTG